MIRGHFLMVRLLRTCYIGYFFWDIDVSLYAGVNVHRSLYKYIHIMIYCKMLNYWRRFIWRKWRIKKFHQN